MAKTKKSASQKKKQNVENEVLVYIYSLVLITLSIIGGLEIGFIGNLTTGIIKYVFGNLYGVIYGLVIILSIMMMLKKSFKNIPVKYIIGTGVLLIGWIIAASFPENEKMRGMEILADYISDSVAILKGEAAARGGLVGAFLISLCTFLFDYMGTKIVLGVLVLLGMILIISGPVFEKLKKGASDVHKQGSEMKRIIEQKKAQKEKQKLDKEEKMAEEDIWSSKEAAVKINMNNSAGKRQVSFLDVDEDFDVISDGRKGIHSEDVNEETIPDFAVSKDDENKRIIEETIGEEDTFISAYTQDYSNYRLPRISLLNETGKRSRSMTNVYAANEAGEQLIAILEQFGVKATLVGTHIGPAVTKFEVKPDLGVRVNKISNLQYDIKMALAAKDIRIEAPIPGKSAVGIEIPNKEKTIVGMRELMRDFPEKYANKKLVVALGKDLMGDNVYCELDKMPHLLIAGATGSGKSVCVNSIITSLLMRTKPDEVQLLLVDPKKVEFTPYHQIPHLIGPVITDTQEANRALKVIVNMMDKRYELFAAAGVKNIDGYNTYLQNHPEENLKMMPRIVVIIDELADLMLAAAKEVEASIQRLTQLARAAGIHLIVATQRPSVDVITGIIKANIPSRIAFAVSSAVDSRTILDQMGAERLLGDGDMLYLPAGESAATRVQGVFVSDSEVKKISDYVTNQAKSKYDDAFLRLEAVDQQFGTNDESADPLYDEVKSFIIKSRKASTSLIQRKFSIGYARAARLMDTLEEHGIIGPSHGSKPRDVLVKYEEDELND